MTVLPVNVAREPAAAEFRRMLYADLQEIILIEHRAYQFCWTEGTFRDCLRAGYHCQVLAVPNGGIIQGYGILSAAAGEAHIFNICVRPELQGRGLARRILDHLLDIARAEAATTVFLEVRESNAPALRLYSQAGFGEIGVRPGYYPAPKGRREDALVMAKAL
jgi:ribosomal-protein-alanine N-acetyltransferase